MIGHLFQFLLQRCQTATFKTNHGNESLKPTHRSCVKTVHLRGQSGTIVTNKKIAFRTFYGTGQQFWARKQKFRQQNVSGRPFFLIWLSFLFCFVAFFFRFFSLSFSFFFLLTTIESFKWKASTSNENSSHSTIKSAAFELKFNRI